VNYPHIASMVFNHPWAVHPDTMGTIVEILSGRMAGMGFSAEEIEHRLEAAASKNGPRQGPRKDSAVAVLPIYGVINPRAGMLAQTSGGTSVESLRAHVRAVLDDPEVHALVFDIDSPGGDVAGVPELAQELFAARGSKPMLAVANTNAFSAAYWLGAQADEFYVTPSGSVGSIGVVAVHEDHTERLAKEGVRPTVVTSSKFKAERSKATALSKEALADIQAEVDAYHDMFIQAVAQGRGVDPGSVTKDYGEGRTFVAKKAEARGMVDGVATLDQVVARAHSLVQLADSQPELVGAYHIDLTNHSSTTTMGEFLPTIVSDGTNAVSNIKLNWEPVPEPFAIRLDRVLGEVEAVAAHAKERADMRAEEGRTLSPATRERLEAMWTHLGELVQATREPVPQQRSSVAGLEAILKQYELEAIRG